MKNKFRPLWKEKQKAKCKKRVKTYHRNFTDLCRVIVVGHR